ncbi:MAG: hypothetical protein J2P46_05220 [Zavarzinella sp.]|nr:hypothetical protein [Zavarzinella sp.]
MPAPKKILDLIHLFDRNADEYRSPTFNEANLRIQFVNPMFKALGWDMENEQGQAEAYKDVIHEAMWASSDRKEARMPLPGSNPPVDPDVGDTARGTCRR